MPAELFKSLDLDGDGYLSRSELTAAANRYGWSWREAPILAVLDLLSISGPIPERAFIAYIQQIRNDPMGPYGDVLRNSPLFPQPVPPKHNPVPTRKKKAAEDLKSKDSSGKAVVPPFHDITGPLAMKAGIDIANRYRSLLESLEAPGISRKNSALLIIDPQRSFTEGAWMQSIGRGAEKDVVPILLAFRNCAALLSRYYGQMEIMLTRCPFPAGSYGWDDRLTDILTGNQLYFIKPGNSVLFPPSNGFREWVARCIESGKNILVIGGCTLNSCVRVSSIDTQKEFCGTGMQVVVDLSLCGARMGNYLSTPKFAGLTAVEAAVKQMMQEGIQIVRHVNWV